MAKLQSQEMAAEIRRLIVTNVITAGQLVSERQLLDLAGGGRTPLRDALQRLSLEYMVQVLPRRGILIPKWSVQDFKLIQDATTSIGNLVVAEAAKNITPAQIQELERIAKAARECEAISDWYCITELDARFHCTIAQASGNPYLADSACRLHTAMMQFSYSAYQESGSAREQNAEHSEIIEALRQGSVADATRSFQQHMMAAAKRMLSRLHKSLLGEEAPEPGYALP